MYIKSMSHNGNYNSQDFEILIEAIDEIAEYSIKFYASQQEKFVKFINDHPDLISKKIDKEHWIYKILKANIYSIEYYRDNTYDNYRECGWENFITEIEKTNREIINSSGISQKLVRKVYL